MDKWINTLKHLIISGMMNKQALFQSNNLSDPFAYRLINYWTETITEYLIIQLMDQYAKYLMY